MAPNAALPLFDVDRELLAAVPPQDRAAAMRSVRLQSRRVSTGWWDPLGGSPPLWGTLIVEGLLVGHLGVGSASTAEVVGAGDLLAPGLTGPMAGAPAEVPRWSVLEPATILLLDGRFEAALRRWPRLAALLLRRMERRLSRIETLNAISNVNRVDTRVLLALWVLSEQCGRVTRDGILLPRALTHRAIGEIVGARRPSVTTAVTGLGHRGLLSRRDDGTWVLHGSPPEELQRLGLMAAPLVAI